MGNPCRGHYAEKTFISQSTYVLKVEGQDDKYMFMADRWIPIDLRNSRYIWIPIIFLDNDRIEIFWKDEWRFE